MTVSSCEPSAPIILVLRFDGTGFTTIGCKKQPSSFWRVLHGKVEFMWKTLCTLYPEPFIDGSTIFTETDNYWVKNTWQLNLAVSLQ